MRYVAPQTLGEALSLLSQEPILVVAGCTDIYPASGRSLPPLTLMDITRISDARGITRTPEGWRFGAATTWSDVIRAELPAAFDGLRQAARQVGSRQIQNSATIAGNICNASPAADGVPPLLALGAVVEIVSQRGSRRVPLSKFITGIRETALRSDEMVIAVHVPETVCTSTGSFIKLGSRTHLVISIAMVAANIWVTDGQISDIALAVGSCSPVAQRLPGMEARFLGSTAARIVELDLREVALLTPLCPIDDIRGSARYRLDIVPELCRRTVLAAMNRGA